MKYGCIGEKLKHSFSKEIHEAFAGYKYELLELAPCEVETYIKGKSFKAINVTIPYKETVIPYLDYIDPAARAIGAVNTVVNKCGKLYGYNTDFYGMKELIAYAGVTLAGKKVVILGTGGTSKTARAVADSLGAGAIITVSRTASDSAIDYDELKRSHTDADVIINTTPVGMYPKIDGQAVILSEFKKLSGVIDVVYNPLRTKLISEAKRLGIPALGGLYMLVAQAVRASEIFLDTAYPDGVTESVYKKLLSEKENIVLIGMPSSGKTTVGRMISEKIGRDFIDTDEELVRKEGRDIPSIFSDMGEDYFREAEKRAVKEVSALTGKVIATGGGIVTRWENVENLRMNGKIFFIDRPKDALIPTEDRPLSKSKDAMEKRYAERYPLYCKASNVRIDADATAEEVKDRIIRSFFE